jgi:hypothetical protein
MLAKSAQKAKHHCNTGTLCWRLHTAAAAAAAAISMQPLYSGKHLQAAANLLCRLSALQPQAPQKHMLLI